MVFVWITGSVFLVLLFLLAVPVAVRLTGSGKPKGYRGKILWLFGAIQFPVGGGDQSRGTGGPGRTPKRKKRRAKKTGRSVRIAPSDIPIATRVVLTLIRRVIRSFSVTVDGELRLGLNDPADTGVLWGEGYALAQRVVASTGLNIYPCFDRATLDFRGSATVRVIPLALFVPVLQAALSREGRMLFHSIRKRK